jgi:hypothetical protein
MCIAGESREANSILLNRESNAAAAATAAAAAAAASSFAPRDSDSGDTLHAPLYNQLTFRLMLL